LVAPIKVFKQGRIIQRVLSSKRIKVPPKGIVKIPITCKSLPNSRAYYFNSKFQRTINTITNYRDFIGFYNSLEKAVVIPRNARLGTIYNYNKDSYYLYILKKESKENNNTNKKNYKENK
jgi:hypothetical protein